MLIKLGKYSMLSIMLFITIALVGCQNLKDAVDDTNEKLEFNKNVSLENIEKLNLGIKKLVTAELLMMK
ncbi:hypothetical protein CV093_12965 [Oceanobacillus sp. 143]|nr:hypothetical protein CV093_12965 [Oceanobacillus sp. 143]